MKFNEIEERGSESDKQDLINVEEDGVEVKTVEELAEGAATLMEAVESGRSGGTGPDVPDFSDDPTEGDDPILDPSPPQVEVPDINIPTPGDYELPFGDIGDQIDLGNIDFSDQTGLLQAQLQMMNILSDLLVRMASQQRQVIDLTQSTNENIRGVFEVERRVLQNVKPFQLVTVNGTNAIENENSPEVVVPQSADTQIPTRELTVKASRANNEKIWFGDDETSPNAGFSLSPGEAITLEVDLREQGLYMSSTEPDQVVELLGVV